MQGYKARLMARWKRRYTTVPIVKWRQKANLIGKETNWLRAAAAHDDLNRQIDYLDNAITEALSEFDGWVQQQIDRARGKRAVRLAKAVTVLKVLPAEALRQAMTASPKAPEFRGTQACSLRAAGLPRPVLSTSSSMR
jgi:hypothetical protein